jgi:lysozyme
MIDVSTYTTVPYDYIASNLKDEEGCKNAPYKCTAGHETIGIGHNLDAQSIDNIIGRHFYGDHISMDEVILIFDHDLKKVLVSIIENIPNFKSYKPSAQYVITSMTFNMGVGGIMKFKNFLKAVDKGDIPVAIKEMEDSKWFVQVPNRAKKLINLLKET